MFVGKTVGVLEALDEDDAYLEFSIRSEVVMDILELRRVGPKKMEMVLKSPLDREVRCIYSPTKTQICNHFGYYLIIL